MQALLHGEAFPGNDLVRAHKQQYGLLNMIGIAPYEQLAHAAPDQQDLVKLLPLGQQKTIRHTAAVKCLTCPAWPGNKHYVFY